MTQIPYQTRSNPGTTIATFRLVYRLQVPTFGLVSRPTTYEVKS